MIPFVNKAFHIDDPLYLWSARQIQQHPADFYGFSANWNGHDLPISDVMQNPPGMCYFLAVAAAVVGWSEPALHLACLVPAVAAIVGTWSLARRFCNRPEMAALSVLTTPLFLVSSTNVMCDTLLVACLVWAVELWLSGLERASRSHLAAGALLVGAAALTKYFGASFILLLFVATLLHRRRASSELLFLLIPVAFLGLYHVWTSKLYGRGLFLDAASYSISTRADYGISGWWRLMTALSFLGGGMLPVFMCVPRILRGHAVGGWVALALGLSVLFGTFPELFNGSAVAELAANGAQRWRIACHLGPFVASGLLSLAITAADLWQHRDRLSLLLALWIGGTFVFAAFLNWTVNGRSLLPVTPALGIILARALEAAPPPGSKSRTYRGLPSLGLALVIAWFVAVADKQLANAARSGARTALQRLQAPGRAIWFSGHWGFQWYMEAGGAQPITVGGAAMHRGDAAVFPFRNSRVFGPPEQTLDPLDITCIPLTTAMATMDKSAGAGFYSDVYGPLPYATGNRGRDCYGLMELRTGLVIERDGSWVLEAN